MDKLVVAEKLESLRRCVQRIQDKAPATLMELETDIDSQDILVLNLTRAVQLCVDIGAHLISEKDVAAAQTMGDVFVTLADLKILSDGSCQQMKKAIGFRNIAVHNYQTINWAIVFAASKEAPADFRQFAKEISNYCQL